MLCTIRMSDEKFNKKIEAILDALRITLQVIANLHTNNINNANSTSSPIKKNVCYFCNVPGHWIQRCPEIPLKFQDHCIRCWSEGHSSKECKFIGTSPAPPWMTELEYQIFLEKRLKSDKQ